MAQDWIDEAISDAEEFFENASDKKIKEALEEADYEYYKDVEPPRYLTPVFEI